MRRSALAALGLMLIAGCGTLPAPPRDHFYRLDLDVPRAAPPVPRAQVVHVPPFDASGLHGERALVYAHADGTSLEQYPYHFWIDSPRTLLQAALVAHLNTLPGVMATAGPARDAARTVRGHILAFERGTGPDGAPQAVVSLRLEVVREAGLAPVSIRTYTRRLAVDDDSVAAAVSAINAATAEIFAEFSREVMAGA